MKNPQPLPLVLPVVPVKKAVKYSCLKCPGYCCSYSEIEITKRDIARLARHFGLEYAQAEARFTKADPIRDIRMLRHRKDHIFDSTCMLFDQQARRCTVYEARPSVCRAYPDTSHCGYYDFLKFERAQQGDPDFIART
jgi:Fe-S-cluster containining protein